MNILILLTSISLSFGSCETVLLQSQEASEKELMINLVNDIRTKGCQCGDKYFPATTKLVWNDLLASTALGHSKDMASKKYFSHFNKSGDNAEGRLDIAGYDWMSYGENLFQSTDPSHGVREAVQAWKDSPGHCSNMMKPYFTEMGIGAYEGYWTQLLGSR